MYLANPRLVKVSYVRIVSFELSKLRVSYCFDVRSGGNFEDSYVFAIIQVEKGKPQLKRVADKRQNG